MSSSPAQKPPAVKEEKDGTNWGDFFKIVVLFILLIILLIGIALIPRYFLLGNECISTPSPYCWKDRCCPGLIVTGNATQDPGVFPYCKLEQIILPQSTEDLGCQITSENDYSDCPDAWRFDCCLCNGDTCNAPQGCSCNSGLSCGAG